MASSEYVFIAPQPTRLGNKLLKAQKNEFRQKKREHIKPLSAFLKLLVVLRLSKAFHQGEKC